MRSAIGFVRRCAAVVGVAAMLASCGATRVVTQTETSTQTITSTTTSTRTQLIHPATTTVTQATTTAGAPATPAAPNGGSVLSVHDFSGNTLDVSADVVADPATPVDAAVANLPARSRLIAVEFTLKGGGPGTVSSDANNDATVIGSDQQAYTASFDPVTDCTNFAQGTFTINPGNTERGCVVYQMPNGVTVNSVQFSLGNGTVEFNSR